ncbi:MAG: zinc-dependent metalloprotease [Actinomycetota bacterium]
MGSYAARLADWDTAVDIGRRVSGPGVPVPGVERARLREDMAEIVPRAEGLIRGFTDMDVQGFRSRAWVMARSEWIRANLNGLQRLLEPLAERMLDGRPSRAELKRKALGAQTGALMGYVARKVLGQYDVFLPPDDEGLLYFVGPNIVEAERRYSLPPKDFRLWIAIHEVTHRVQFGSAAWLRGYLSGQVDDYLGSIQLDAGQLMNQLRRAAEEVRSGLDRRGMGGVFLLLSPEQREMFMRMQALMSLLEGHASYVMNEVARDHVKDVDRMRRALSARRRASNLERTLQKAIGFEQKIRQYDTGERFVRTIVDRAGMSTFNLVWRSAGDLPTLDEIGEPERWLVRVGG